METEPDQKQPRAALAAEAEAMLDAVNAGLPMHEDAIEFYLAQYEWNTP